MLPFWSLLHTSPPLQSTSCFLLLLFLYPSTTEVEHILVPHTGVEKMPSKKSLSVFSHRQKVPPPRSIHVTPTSPTAGPQHPQPSSAPIFDLLITLRKGERSTTAHPIFRFVSYNKLNTLFRQFALSLYSISIFRSFEEAVLIFAWHTAMEEKMQALSRGTWALITLPPQC